MHRTGIAWKRLPLILGVAAVLATTALRAQRPVDIEYNPARRQPAQEETSGRIIVKLHQAARLAALNTAGRESVDVAAVDAPRLQSLAARAQFVVRESRALGGGMHALRIETAGGESVAEAMARLRADGDVDYAVPDRRVYAHATSNDPLASGQWFLAPTQLSAQPSPTYSAINAQGAWNTSTGSPDLVIAVVDTGVLFDHPDLGRAAAGGRILPGYDFISADSPGVFKTANDGDGRDADASDPGDWTTATDCTPAAAATSSSWHGTRVSGIIAAMTNNGVGVAGVTWNASILPVRVLGKCGGYNSDVLAGIRWAAGLSVPGVPANPTPARIINVSLGSTGACDAASQDTITQVSAAGVVVVASAGNEGGPVGSPASCAGAMAILGLRHAGTKVGFSSLGPEIALGAPGGNCVNTGVGQPCLFSIDTTSNAGTTVPGAYTYTNQLDYNVGTSFSSPIVSGIAALMLAVNGNLKSAQLIRRMQLGSSPFPTTSDTGTPPVCHVPTGATDTQPVECVCTTSVCGAGMANAQGALNEALRPIATIAAPTSFAANSLVILNGNASAGASGRSIASYAWSVLGGPNTLATTNGTSTTVTAPATGATVVQLLVTDDLGRTDAATIAVGATATATDAVTVQATDASASEAGPDTGKFTLTRIGNSDATLTVNFTLTGTASSGTDYATVGSTAVIPAGQASTTVTVTPLDDATAEPAKTAILTLQNGSGYLADPASATVTIADNDTPVAPAATGGSGGKGGGALDAAGLLGALALLLRMAHRRVTFRPIRS